VGLPKLKRMAAHILYIPPLARIEVSISFVENMHSQDPPIVPKARCRINSFIAIPRPLLKDLEVWHFCLSEKKERIVSKLAAEPK